MKAEQLIIVAVAFSTALVLAACASGNSGFTNGSSSQSSALAAVSAQASTTSSKQVTTPAKAGSVTAGDVASLEEGAYLVDTRSSEEYAEGHIPGALNASYPKSTGGPCQTKENSASFRSAWAKLGIPQNAHVVVYCRTGVRATAAASALIEDGYTNVDVYEGSWTDWTSDSSRPVEV